MNMNNTQFLLFTMCLYSGYWLYWSEMVYKFNICKRVKSYSGIGRFYTESIVLHDLKLKR